MEEGYRNLPFPFEERRLPDLAIEVAWTLDELLGYVGTWSAVKEAGKALGQDPAPRSSMSCAKPGATRRRAIGSVGR